ncbi:MAG: response regulator receiver modulated CheB methylesterase [Verrucomicrobiales bacterium]|jgi:two-component system chemotaxis response regulator CheB|nr:response regulator receiver modulated CheB methylesterase [Verrucomicrobiales bacterium]
MTTLIRTLIVDDSAFVRKVVREMLGRSPFIQVVGMARDGEEALEMVAELNPDVVTCDMVMPRLDGVGFVRAQMARKPVSILILSASAEDGPRVLEAIEAGAVDFVQKPTALATDELLNIRDELIEKVKTAARAPVEKLHPASAVSVPTVYRPHPLKVEVVVLGISTGGPQALRYLLPQFPADFPVPIAMVLHMPVGYTALFAEHLNELSKLKVTEAREGDFLRPGMALLAPAGRHLLLKRNGNGSIFAVLATQPIEKPHRPSVDVLFQSAAEELREKVLGVVMTGMGDDGKQGSAWIKAQGGRVITESESSCIIYGMPRSVAEAGLSDASFSLQTMAEGIMKFI